MILASMLSIPEATDHPPTHTPPHRHNSDEDLIHL